MMIKTPQAGTSKTRLVPPLAPDEAADLSVCFLRDTAANIVGITSLGGAEGIAVYTPLGSEAAFDNLLPETFILLAQRGESFGERLLYATEDLLSAGYESLCLINSDSPTLPSALLKQAVDALARAGDRVILGPSDDGGYYLIGLKHAHRHLFSNVDWSTSRVLAQTIKRAAEIELDIEVLPSWYDVDDGLSLSYLCNELFSSNGEGVKRTPLVGYSAAYTRSYLSWLLERQGRERIWPNKTVDEAITG